MSKSMRSDRGAQAVFLRLLAVAMIASMAFALAGTAYAAEGEEPLPAGPSEEYSQDPSDVSGDGEEEAPVPAGPSEEYDAGDEDVVGDAAEPEVEEPMLPFTEATDPDLTESFLPFTGGDPSLLVLAGFSAAAGLALRRMERGQ